MAACAAGADVSCLAHQGGEVWGRRGTGCAGPMRLSCAWAGRRNADLCQQHCWAVASQAGVALAQLLEELGEKAFPLPLHELRVILPGRGPVFVDSSGWDATST